MIGYRCYFFVMCVMIGCRGRRDEEADGGRDEEESGGDGGYEAVLGGENERAE